MSQGSGGKGMVGLVIKFHRQNLLKIQIESHRHMEMNEGLSKQ